MKMKKYLWLFLLAGFVFLIAGFLIPFLVLHAATPAESIIGGADSPTYLFILTTYGGGFPVYLVLLGAILIIVSLFILICRKLHK